MFFRTCFKCRHRRTTQWLKRLVCQQLRATYQTWPPCDRTQSVSRSLMPSYYFPRHIRGLYEQIEVEKRHGLICISSLRVLRVFQCPWERTTGTTRAFQRFAWTPTPTEYRPRCCRIRARHLYVFSRMCWAPAEDIKASFQTETILTFLIRILRHRLEIWCARQSTPHMSVVLLWISLFRICLN